MIKNNKFNNLQILKPYYLINPFSIIKRVQCKTINIFPIFSVVTIFKYHNCVKKNTKSSVQFIIHFYYIGN